METLSAQTAAAIAWWYDLGVVTGDLVLAARGEQGRIWRLDTSRGLWAVKELLVPAQEEWAARDVEFQCAAHLAGISLVRARTRIHHMLSDSLTRARVDYLLHLIG